MEKILSQDEVDALLKGLSDGDIESGKEGASEQEGIRAYDLTSQDRIVRGRMPTLEIINDRFARLHRVSLSTALRKVLDVSVGQSEMVKFGEFVRTLPVPTSLHIIKLEPLRGVALLMIESRLIFNLVDCFFGGTGKSHFKVEGRDFTSIEYRVINKLVQSALKDFDQAWKPVVPLSFQFVRSEVNPQFAAIVAPTDLVIVIPFEMEMERLIGRMALCLPYSTIEPIRSKLFASYQSDQLEIDQEWTARLKRRLHEVGVNLLLELGRTTITGGELLNMEIGDVIGLDNVSTEPLTVKVQGVPKFKASPGIFRGNQAFQIREDIWPAES